MDDGKKFVATNKYERTWSLNLHANLLAPQQMPNVQGLHSLPQRRLYQ